MTIPFRSHSFLNSCMVAWNLHKFSLPSSLCATQVLIYHLCFIRRDAIVIIVAAAFVAAAVFDAAVDENDICCRSVDVACLSPENV